VFYFIIILYDLGHEAIVRQCQFDLAGMKTSAKRNLNNNRMPRKMYAIICRTNIAGKRKTCIL
jgi:hypothetical protein